MLISRLSAVLSIPIRVFCSSSEVRILGAVKNESFRRIIFPTTTKYVNINFMKYCTTTTTTTLHKQEKDASTSSQTTTHKLEEDPTTPRPSNEDGSAVADQSRPSNEDGSAVADQSRPSNEDGSAVADQSRPSNEDGSAVADQSRPSNEDGSAEADQSRPSNEDGSAEADQSRPSNGEGSTEADQSSSFDEDNYNEENIRLQVLNAALPFVSTLGWSSDAISKGADSLGYSSMAHGMFPDGGIELVNHFFQHCNDQLEQHLKSVIDEQQKHLEKKIGTSKFIRDAIEFRLRKNSEYIDRWPQAMALHAAPSNLPKALHNIGSLVDHIWYYAGDKSNNFNWYTKRGVVAAIYNSTEICMVQDKSIDFKDTWEFLGRRMSDVETAVAYLQEANSRTKDVGTLAEAIVLTVLNIIGLNKKTR